MKVMTQEDENAHGLRIRPASQRDAGGMLSIYAPFIKNTSFTFETDVPAEDTFAGRISLYMENWPWLVCEVNGEIAGYAYATKYRERTGYQWCTESSVYIHDNYQRMGIARALYTALFNILKKQGYINVYAVINLPNDKSVALHESCGFTWFATYDHVGYKLGRWKDVGWWQLQLSPYIDAPPPPVRFAAMDHVFLADVFTMAGKMIKPV